MAKRMTLDETWKNCLSMWRWIAKMWRLGCSQNVEELKTEWCEAHGFDMIESGCFFCHHNGGALENMCRKCPARKVDADFFCMDTHYSYNRHPIAFYNKLVSLNRKRLKGKK